MASFLDGIHVDVAVSGFVRLDLTVDQSTWDKLSHTDRLRLIRLLPAPVAEP